MFHRAFKHKNYQILSQNSMQKATPIFGSTSKYQSKWKIVLKYWQPSHFMSLCIFQDKCLKLGSYVLGTITKLSSGQNFDLGLRSENIEF